MKKYFLTIAVISFLFVSFFSMNLEKSFEYFSDYVKEYKAGNSFIEKDLELLSEYREYYVNMISSIKSDVQGNETDKLLERIFNENLSGVFEKDFAFAVLISYISADLHNESFTEEYLNQSPPFYKTFNNYVEGIKNEAISYVSQWIGYSLGILRSKPDELFDIAKIPVPVKSRLKIPYDKNIQYFGIFMENSDDELSSRISEAVSRAAREIGTKTDDNTVSRAIRKAAIYAVSPITGNIANEQSLVATEFVSILPREINLNTLRFLIYLIVMLISFFVIKNKKISKYLLYGIIFAEIVFLSLTGELYNSDVEALFYGIFAVSIVTFSFIMTITRSMDAKLRTKREPANILLFICMVSIVLIPVFDNLESLRMDNIDGFSDSFFSEDLKEKIIGNDGTIYKLINSDIKDTDYIKNELLKTVKYAGTDLRKDIFEYLNADNTWKNNSEFKTEIVDYFEKISKENASISPSVSLLQTQFGSLFIIIFMVIISILTFIKIEKMDLFVLYSILTVGFCLFVFKRSHRIFIEKGSPFIEVGNVYPNIIVILLFLITVALSFFIRFKNISKEV